MAPTNELMLKNYHVQTICEGVLEDLLAKVIPEPEDGVSELDVKEPSLMDVKVSKAALEDLLSKVNPGLVAQVSKPELKAEPDYKVSKAKDPVMEVSYSESKVKVSEPETEPNAEYPVLDSESEVKVSEPEIKDSEMKIKVSEPEVEVSESVMETVLDPESEVKVSELEVEGSKPELEVSELETKDPLLVSDVESGAKVFEPKAKDLVLCVVQKYGDKSQLVISNPINPNVFDSKSEKVEVSESEAKVVQGVLPFLSSNQAKVSESEAKGQ